MAKSDIERGFKNIIKNWFVRLNVERKELADRYGYSYDEAKKTTDDIKTAKVRFYAINCDTKRRFVDEILAMNNNQLLTEYLDSLNYDCTIGTEYNEISDWTRMAMRFELDARLKASGFLEATE